MKWELIMTRNPFNPNENSPVVRIIGINTKSRRGISNHTGRKEHSRSGLVKSDSIVPHRPDLMTKSSPGA